MARSLLSITAFVVTLGIAFAASAQPAAADTSDEAYRRAIKDLVELTDAWDAELSVHLGAISVKPQLACTSEFTDVLARGRWLSDDLRGTAFSAPAQVAEANHAAGAAFESMLTGALLVAQDCDGNTFSAGAALVSGGHSGYATAAARLRHYVVTSGIRAVPARPIVPTLPGLGG
jgi:hypothetical protein